MTDATWREVNKRYPCPICEKADWCGQTADGAVRCMRLADAPAGWRLQKATDSHGGTVFIPESASAWQRSNRPKPMPPKPPALLRDWSKDAAVYSAAITDQQVARLAGQLGVAPDALRAISVGWHAGRGAYTFPEIDGRGVVIGISTRTTDGKKFFVKGGHRGLTVPDGLDDLPGMVLLVEGQSDTAACWSMRLPAVGRPSNQGGSEHIAKLLDGHDVLVVGENDGKPGGAWPGRTGAIAVTQNLANAWNRAVRWAMPPTETKDTRGFLNGRAIDLAEAQARAEAGAAFLEALAENTETVQPTAPKPAYKARSRFLRSRRGRVTYVK